MGTLKIFENPEFGKIRTMKIDEEPWLVGKDAAEILGYSNPSKAVLDHVDEDDKRFVMLRVSDSQNGNLVKTAVINESGLYSLVLSSKLPTAKKFKRWVTSEVLPAIRKTGSYQVKSERKYMALPSVNHSVEILRKAWERAGVDEKRMAAAVTSIYQQVYKEEGVEIPSLPIHVEKTYDKEQLAKEIGIVSRSGLPHSKAVGAIIQQLRIPDALIEHSPFSKNGHSDDYDRYKSPILEMLRDWLIHHNWPEKISADNGKTFYIRYQQEKAG